mgnify:CR=1 FL=1
MFLDRIVAQTRSDIERRKQERPLEELRPLVRTQAAPHDLVKILKTDGKVHLIAEVKRASPSKGMLAPHLDPIELARVYEDSGASAISVLTEPHFFLGSLDYLRAIKRTVEIPVLRKDFIIDEYQVYEARTYGADAILLLCAILDDAQLQHLLTVAHALDMRCLIETHTRQEVQRAVASGALLIGVNSRDLVTFEVYPELIRDLRPLIPPDRVVVAESGIRTAADASRLARYNIQAMLVGESLVTSNNIPAQMQVLLQATTGAWRNQGAEINGL